MLKSRPNRNEYSQMSLFFRFVVNVIRLFIKFRVKRVVENIDKIPSEGPCIVIANHFNEFDAVLATEFVTQAHRAPRIFAKSSLWKIPIVKQAFNSGNLIPVNRGTKEAAKSLEVANEGLKNGDLIFIFPEGTISKDPQSWPMTCKTGAARLAIMSNAKVIPILQDGAQFLSKTCDKNVSWYQKHKKGNKVLIHLKAFDPIDFTDLFTKSSDNLDEISDDLVKKVNQRIESTLTKIVEENRGVKAPKRWNPTLNNGLGGRE